MILHDQALDKLVARLDEALQSTSSCYTNHST